jgi:hypothetical protein
METDKRIGIVLFRIAVLCFCFLAAVGALAQQPGTPGAGKPAFTTFDAPDAGTAPFEGTVPSSINAAGIIVGTVGTAGPLNPLQAFVRQADGTITDFIYPGGTNAISTVPAAINAKGTIAGYYLWEGNTTGGLAVVGYGFVRSADGTFTTFSAPNAGNGAYPYHQGTFPLTINTTGMIAGYYTDASGLSHGFTGTAGGTITSFDPTGSSGTYGESINAAGAIAGYYVDDVAGAYHGFVRAPDGSITSFDAPGASTGNGKGTQAWSINTAGTIAGCYSDASGVYHGFARIASGATATFDVPGAGTAQGEGTFALSINAEGVIAGHYFDAKGLPYGFVRAANGAISAFGAPGAGTGTGNGYGGTYPTSINNDAVAGWYMDANGVGHGFLLTK